MSRSASPYTDAAAWFAAGNTDQRLVNLCLENLLVELSARGRSPLAVYEGSPPFFTPSPKMEVRDRLGRTLEHFTDAAVPAIGLAALSENLESPRMRERFKAEGQRFGAVIVQGSSITEAGLPAVADGVVLFASKDAGAPGWIYKFVKTLSGLGSLLPVCVVAVNAAHLEEAGVFFQDVKDEVDALLGRDARLHFAGFLRIEPDYVNAALQARRPLVMHFPGSPFHGQISYLIKAMERAVPHPPATSFLERMAALAESRG